MLIFELLVGLTIGTAVLIFLLRVDEVLKTALEVVIAQVLLNYREWGNRRKSAKAVL
jgi:hypothetical protein